jgi:hypothetical protein
MYFGAWRLTRFNEARLQMFKSFVIQRRESLYERRRPWACPRSRRHVGYSDHGAFG